jgi:hypothetical protein
MVKDQVEYDATLWAQRDAQREKRFEDKLKRQAQQLGYQLDYHSVDTYTIQHFCARMVYAIHNEAASADSYCG